MVNLSWILIAAFLLFVNCGCESSKHKAIEEMAARQTEAWLKLADGGDAAESWQQSAPFFQNAISPEDWENTLNNQRKPLGEVKSRELISARYQTSLPGAPDGDYVLVTFHTAFANNAEAIETITQMKTSDNSWKVAGYYIK